MQLGDRALRPLLLLPAPEKLQEYSIYNLGSSTSKNLSLRMSLHFRSLPRKPSSINSDTKERKADDLGAASLQKKQEYLPPNFSRNPENIPSEVVSSVDCLMRKNALWLHQ
ncbi:hypothetical protein AVEN_150212-1 [Araneus ventricosus]|uniref:Uncharacterized protein n=1 Tax=Araneus ventricosus TaxID=182803 RepID=A0A4Y2QHS8_ARAVE|nr:hypothetical protein AVEN_150212-1 [Araneus ventricosus]